MVAQAPPQPPLPPQSQGGGGYGGLSLGGIPAAVPNINMSMNAAPPTFGGGMLHDQGVSMVGNNQGFANPMLPMSAAQFANVPPTKVRNRMLLPPLLLNKLLPLLILLRLLILLLLLLLLLLLHGFILVLFSINA